VGLQKTNIEWVFNPDGSRPGFSANPITGKCPVGCYYCYAERIRKRFKRPEKIEFHPEVLEAIERRKKNAGIFMGSAFEMFDHNIKHVWIRSILDTVQRCPQHTFYFLTKKPMNYRLYSFHRNCWLGVTIDCRPLFSERHFLTTYKWPQIFISFEPLLKFDDSSLNLIPTVQWIIVGAMTKPGGQIDWEYAPKLEWLEGIREKCFKNNIPLFEKDNLQKIVPSWELIQQKPF